MSIKKKLGNEFRNLTLNRHPSLYRPSSLPFLTGDTLRKFSDHIFDETRTLSPTDIKKGDIIFLKTNMKNIFFPHYHSKINQEYILICHNSDASFNEVDLELLDSKIIHCFSQNLNIETSDIVSILPIGFENARFRNNGVVKNLKVFESTATFKKDKIFSSFNIRTNFQIRNNLFQKIKYRDDININYSTDNVEYLRELSNHRFNLCPIGNGLDTHRIWETLLVGSTPVVERNNLTTNLFNLDVPMIILDNWNDLDSLNMNDLINLNKINKDKDGFKFTQFNFWWDKVMSKKN